MNPNDRDLDDLLDERGGRIGDLYRRLPRYEPPRRLDRAVLGEAARAVRSGKPPRRQRWIVGVGSAAGLVLAAGIAWRIGHEPMTTETGDERVRVVPVQPITESPRARRDEEPARESPAAPPPASAPVSQPSGAISQRVDADAAKRTRKPVPREKALRPEASPAPKPATAAPEPAPPPAAAARTEPFPQARDAEAPATKSENAAAGAAAAETAAKSARRDNASSDLFQRAAPPTPPSSSVELQRDMQLAPRDWLSHIRELVRQGRRQQAIESLRLFVHAHPDSRVPDDLQPLLQ